MNLFLLYHKPIALRGNKLVVAENHNLSRNPSEVKAEEKKESRRKKRKKRENKENSIKIIMLNLNEQRILTRALMSKEDKWESKVSPALDHYYYCYFPPHSELTLIFLCTRDWILCCTICTNFHLHFDFYSYFHFKESEETKEERREKRN